MAPDILDLTSKFMRDPVRILVKKDELTRRVLDSFIMQLKKKIGNLILYVIYMKL